MGRYRRVREAAAAAVVVVEDGGVGQKWKRHHEAKRGQILRSESH